MGRAKIKVELIQDHKKRMTTLVKRKAGLVKKISELSILCDIKACMIIYEGNNHQVIPSQVDQIWPDDPNEVKELINLYKNQPFQGRSKRDKTLSNHFENDQKKKVEMVAKKYPTWDSRFDYLSEKELQNLVGVLEKKMENAKRKVEFLKSTKIQGSNIGISLSHQEIWDLPELMNDDNLMNQTTMWPISYVNSMAEGMDHGLLTIEDYQFCNANYSLMIEAENWSANDGIGSSSTMQPMANNEIGSCLTMQPMANNEIGSCSTMQPMANNKIGSCSTMQPMGNNNGIGSSSTMQPMVNSGIGSSLTMQPMDQYSFIYNDSTHDMPYGFL